MALESWTDGHKEGSLMPPSQWIRLCTQCNEIYNIRDAEPIDEYTNEEMYDFIETPHKPPTTLAQKTWRFLVGESPPTMTRVIRPDLPPYIEYLPKTELNTRLGSLLKDPTKHIKHHHAFEAELRLRLWRMGNDWYRPAYLEARKSGVSSPPTWSLTDEQIEHLEKLVELFANDDIRSGDELIPIEIFRQLRRFKEAEEALSQIKESGRWSLYQKALIDQKMSHVGLYPS